MSNRKNYILDLHPQLWQLSRLFVSAPAEETQQHHIQKRSSAVGNQSIRAPVPQLVEVTWSRQGRVCFSTVGHCSGKFLNSHFWWFQYIEHPCQSVPLWARKSSPRWVGHFLPFTVEAEWSEWVQGFPQLLQCRHWNGLGHKCRCQLWLVSQQVGDNKALGSEFHALFKYFVVGNQLVSLHHLENCFYFLKKCSWPDATQMCNESPRCYHPAHSAGWKQHPPWHHNHWESKGAE